MDYSEEVVLAKGITKTSVKMKRLLIISAGLFIAGIILLLVIWNAGTFESSAQRVKNPLTGNTLYFPASTELYKEFYEGRFGDFLTDYFFYKGLGIFNFICIILGIIGLFVSLYLKRKTQGSNVNVTNLRVAGNTSFGKQVDIPLAQISSVEKCAFDGVSISTSGGKATKFWHLGNQDEIYEAISKAMTKR